MRAAVAQRRTAEARERRPETTSRRLARFPRRPRSSPAALLFSSFFARIFTHSFAPFIAQPSLHTFVSSTPPRRPLSLMMPYPPAPLAPSYSRERYLPRRLYFPHGVSKACVELNLEYKRARDAERPRSLGLLSPPSWLLISNGFRARSGGNSTCSDARGSTNFVNLYSRGIELAREAAGGWSLMKF